MHEGMGGLHVFAIDVRTNDPARPQVTLTVIADYY
jgi:hypothetical protein